MVCLFLLAQSEKIRTAWRAWRGIVRVWRFCASPLTRRTRLPGIRAVWRYSGYLRRGGGDSLNARRRRLASALANWQRRGGVSRQRRQYQTAAVTWARRQRCVC